MSEKLKERAALFISSEYQIAEGTFIAMFERGLIDETAVRNTLIREEAKCICRNHTKEDAIVILSNRYSCSDDTVRKVIYGQSKK